MKCQVLRSNEVSDNRKKNYRKLKVHLIFAPGLGSHLSGSNLNILRSWIPGPTLGVPRPGSYICILGSRVLGPGVPPVDVLGSGSYFSDMPIWCLNSWLHWMSPSFWFFLMSTKNFCGNKKDFWPFGALTSPNDQTHSNSSSANCQQIVWVYLTILWGWRLRS